MIDEGRDAPVRVVLGVFGRLLLELVEVEVDALVGEAKLGQDESDLPVDMPEVNQMERIRPQLSLPAIRTALVRVEGELLAVRHPVWWGSGSPG